MRFAELATYLPRLEAQIRSDYRLERRRAPPPFRSYVDALSEFTLRGGKRLRALLVLAGFHLATGRRPDPALPAAAAFEHFQTWMLVHDDIIDHAETRRNGPALHRRYEAELRALGVEAPAAEYGVAMGITLGDLAEPFTVGAFLATRAAPAAKLAALAAYVRMTRETAYGQALDIRNAMRPVGEVRESDVLAVHRYKTAFYTVAGPLGTGARLGGGPAGLLEDLEAIGLDYGVAFQLRDDVLGAGFDDGASGKSANDLIEGKRTLLVVRAWASGGPADRSALESVLGRPAATDAEVVRAREVLRSTGSLAYSEARIAALVARADRRLEKSRRFSKEGKSLIREIGDRLVHRSS